MMTYEAAKQLFDGAGLPLTESHFAQFQCYLAELTETNRHMNLTAITEPAEAWEKHFLDCAILLQKVQLPLGAACIDVGTGAGFPGMVLALLRPDLQVTLLDSLQKRIGFLEQTTAKLGLANVRCIHARAEDGAKLPELREQFDMATARAVAAMPVLTEYCLPFVKQGGVFAAMKGPSEMAEQAEAAAKLLGGALDPDKTLELRITATDGFGQSALRTESLAGRRWAMKLRPDVLGVGFGMSPQEGNALELPDGWRVLIGGRSAAEQAWPVGAVFWTPEATNPASLLGFGTWSRVNSALPAAWKRET